MGDLKNPRAIIFKGMLFFCLGVASLFLLVCFTMSWLVAGLAGICIWSFCRFYYFAFYVIENYVDDEFRFSGLTDFARYLLQRKSGTH